MDGMPVSFTWPVEKESLDWNDIEFERSDGSIVMPWCVTLKPQNDANEGFTVLTFGQYETTESPTEGPVVGPALTKVRVVGDLILNNGTHRFNVKGSEASGGNLDYMKGGVLKFAYIRPYAAALNPIPEGDFDNCLQYQDVTHVLSLATIAGASKDGVNQFDSDQFQLFDVKMTNGTDLSKDHFAGIADRDGDDITDVCLRLSQEDADSVVEVSMRCDMSNRLERWSLPEGLYFDCSDSQPQPVTRVRCPFSSVCR